MRVVCVAAANTVGTDLHEVQFCAPESGHRMRVMGYLRRPGPAGLDCDAPLRVVCRDCDHQAVWRCGGHRESVCGPCAARYRRRVRAVATSGLGLRQGGYLYMLTLTAPGDRAHALPDGTRCACTPLGGVDLPRWNASHSRRWNHFRTVLKADTPEVQFFRGIEVQTRGALHDHALIWSPVPLVLSELRQLAIRAGFGHSVDLAPVQPGSKKCAYYVSKYVTKATDSRALVPWLGQVVNLRTGEVTLGIVPGRYRTWSMSREWGTTMAKVKALAGAYARVRAAEQEASADERGRAVLAAILGPLTPLDPVPI